LPIFFLLSSKDFPISADIFIDLAWVRFQRKEIDGAKKAAFHQSQVDGGGNLPKKQQKFPKIK
jgi:hypothetical protein